MEPDQLLGLYSFGYSKLLDGHHKLSFQFKLTTPSDPLSQLHLYICCEVCCDLVLLMVTAIVGFREMNPEIPVCTSHASRF